MKHTDRVQHPADGEAPVPREHSRSLDLEILELMTRGATDRQIARQVHLAEASVQRRLAKLMRSLGAVNRPNLALRAFELGWIVTTHMTIAGDVPLPS